MEYIIAIYALLLTYLQYTFGYVLVVRGQSILSSISDTASISNSSFNKPDIKAVNYVPFIWLLGLLFHITFVFLLKSLGLPWPIAVYLPFVLQLFFLHNVRDAISIFNNSIRKIFTLPFIAWLLVQLALAVSLFSAQDSIRTYWVNNYGDLAFHLGMIHHFTLQGDFPPDYHLYAGQTLSYPFFVNLWTAMLWWPGESLSALKGVFVVQWVLLWSCVYYFLSYRKAFFLPWVLLLGGGSYFAIIEQPQTYSWRLIGEGYPWTTWLSTIWVTQRSALMGLSCCLASCALVFNLHRFSKHGAMHMAFAGIILGLMPLVHTHYFVFTSVFLGAYLFYSVLPLIFSRSFASAAKGYLSLIKHPASISFLSLFLPALVAVAFFPFLLGKSGMTSVMLGWSVPLQKPGWESVNTSFSMWMSNAGQWFIVFLALWWLTKKHLIFILLTLLFVVANVIKLAVWEWDQIKVFLVIFSIFAMVWSIYINDSEWNLKTIALNTMFTLLLIGPGSYEVWRLWQAKENYEIYDKSKVALAKLIQETVPEKAIIASPTDHNSAATLSGRSLFMGYPGTLASHSIAYRSRENIHLNIHSLRFCKKRSDIDLALCPEYIVWDHSARKYWHRVTPGEGFEKIAVTKDGFYSIYRILPD